MAETVSSIHQRTYIKNVDVEEHKPFLGWRASKEISVSVEAAGEERREKREWSISGAVSRWAVAAREVYTRPVVENPKKFAELSAIVVANQAMVERILDQGGDWRRAYARDRKNLAVIEFTRDTVEGNTREDFESAARKIEEWWKAGRRFRVEPPGQTLVGLYTDKLMQVPEETRRLGYELVVAGFRTLARRMAVNNGEMGIPVISEAVGPLCFFRIKLVDDELIAGNPVERAALMRVTSEPGSNESVGARRARLIKAEEEMRREIYLAKVRAREREERKMRKRDGERLAAEELRKQGGAEVQTHRSAELELVVAAADMGAARAVSAQEETDRGRVVEATPDWRSAADRLRGRVGPRDESARDQVGGRGVDRLRRTR